MCRVISSVAFPVCYLLGHDGTTASSFASTGSLDCCIERKQVGLRGYAADDVADLTDFVNRRRKTPDGIRNRLCFARCLARDGRRIGDAGHNVFDRLRDFLGDSHYWWRRWFFRVRRLSSIDLSSIPAIHPTGAIGVFKAARMPSRRAERLRRAVEGGNFAENDLIVRYAVGRTQPRFAKGESRLLLADKEKTHQRGV